MNPENTFIVIHRHVQSGKRFLPPMFIFQDEVKQHNTLPFYSSTHTANKHLTWSLLIPSSFCIFCFCWLFHCLKWSPSVVVRFWLVFLSTRRLWCGVIWVAQSVKHLTLAQVIILQFVGLSPVSGSVQTAEPGACFGFYVSLSFSLSTPLSSCSLSQKQTLRRQWYALWRKYRC